MGIKSSNNNIKNYFLATFLNLELHIRLVIVWRDFCLLDSIALKVLVGCYRPCIWGFLVMNVKPSWNPLHKLETIAYKTIERSFTTLTTCSVHNIKLANYDPTFVLMITYRDISVSIVSFVSWAHHLEVEVDFLFHKHVFLVLCTSRMIQKIDMHEWIYKCRCEVLDPWT